MSKTFELEAEISLDSSKYEKGLSEASKSTQSAGSALKKGLGTAAKIGAGALAAASGAVVAFGKKSVDAGMDFDKSMSQVAATMGYATDEINKDGSEANKTFNQLRDFAQKMGSETAFSATEASDALNYMALAGYDAEKSMKMLPTVLDLAAAGGMDLAAASDMVTDASSALGLSTKETTQMVDQMAKASSKSNTSVSQLGDAMLTIGATARNVKGGTQELSTMLGVLADNGIKGSEGGTHLRNVILSLQNPTDKAAKAMKQMGLDVYDANGKMRSLPEIMGDIQKATEGMDQKSKDAITSGIFNKTDLASVNALLNTSQERFSELSKEIGNANGAAKDMAETQLDNLAGQVTLFKSALEGAQIAVSDQLSPTLKDFVKLGAEGLGKMTSAFKEDGLGGAMSVFGDYLSQAIGKIVDLLPTIIDAGAQMLSALTTGLIQNLPEVAKAGTTILKTLADSIVKSLPELVTTMTDVTLQVIQTISDTLPQVIQAVSAMLPQLIPKVIEGILLITQALIDNIPMLIDGAIQLFSGIAQGLINAIPIIVEKLPTLITGLINGILGALPQIIEAGVQLLTGLVQNLPAIITGILNALPQIIDALINGLLGSITALVDAGVQLLTAIVQNLPAIINGIVNALPQIIDSIINGLLTAIPQLIDAGIKLFLAIIENMPKIIAGIVKAIPRIIKSIINALIKAIPQLVQTGIKMFTSLIKNLPKIIVEIVKGIGEITGAIRDAFADFDLIETGKNLIEGLWKGIKDMAGWIADKLKGFGKGVIDTVKKVFGEHSPSKVFAEIGGYLAEGLGNGWEDEYPEVKRQITSDLDFSATPIKATSQNQSLRRELFEATNMIVDAINNQGETSIILNNRELGRAVRAYA